VLTVSITGTRGIGERDERHQGAFRLVSTTADAAVATAGAVGGAAVNGVVGGVRGVASGVRDGATSGSHSTSAAALTLGLIGAAGLVEWPLLVGIGGTALVVRQLTHNDRPPAEPRLRAVTEPAPARKAPVRKAPARKAPARTAPANKRTAAKAPAKKAAKKTTKRTAATKSAPRTR
jgi:hypothetical protein